MDLTKAQRLLNKIQAFLDNGNVQELSRLEKDLIKSYVQQLYEAVVSEEQPPAHDPQKKEEHIEPKKVREEPVISVEIPTIKVAEIPKPELPKVEYPEYKPPAYNDKPLEVVKSSIQEVETTPKAEPKSFHFNVPDPVKQTIHVTSKPTGAIGPQEALNKLFEVQKSDEVSRFGHVPISSIESAMGLNERIFTLNELFGGNKALFDATCAKLNSLASFAEARNVLMSGPATDFKWGEPERIKMAEQFIRIVSRKYPKSAS